LRVMKRLWGRKVSDLAFSKFMRILKHIALLRGKQVVQIGRFERTTGKCSRCGHEQAMDLNARTFACQNPTCGWVIERDHNAALNILDLGKGRYAHESGKPPFPNHVGTSTYTGLDLVSPSSEGSVI
jgi:putative transposase